MKFEFLNFLIKPMIQTVIFDMDGVIVDTEPVHHFAYQQHFKQLNIDVSPEMYASFTGNSTKNIYERLKSVYNLQQDVKTLVEVKRNLFNDAFEKNIDNKWIYKILETLWEFTNTDRLDIWDEKIEDLNPWNILEEHPDNNPSDYKTLSINEFNELYIFYNSLDKNFIDMIGNVIEIGTGNLYGATGKFSLFSLKPTLEVLRIAKLEIKQIPDINFFEFSKFSEENGWGNNFSKDKLKNMW